MLAPRLAIPLLLLAAFAVLAAGVRFGQVPGDVFVAQRVHCDDFEPYRLIFRVAQITVWVPLALVAVVLSTEVVGALAWTLVDREVTVRGEPLSGFEHLLAPGVFPSGHTLRSTATLVIVVATLGWPRQAWRWRAVGIAVAWLLVLSLSLLEIQAHWLSDVIGGLLLGAGWAGLLLVLVRPRLGRLAVVGTRGHHPAIAA